MAMSKEMNDNRLGPYCGDGLTPMTPERLNQLTLSLWTELFLRKIAKALAEGSSQ